VLPGLIKGAIDLEGHPLYPIEVGQADIAPSTVLHVPSIDPVVPGDAVYNKIHMMLGLHEEWDRWLESIDKIEKLSPKMLVAGHKRPEASDLEVKRIIDESRAYIQAFASEAKKAANADDLIQKISAKYPDFGNLFTLQFSAKSYFARRRG
jgi:hypothetical protein